MAEIVRFPRPVPPLLSVVGGTDFAAGSTASHGDRLVAEAMTDIASAVMLIVVARAAAEAENMDCGDLISNEVVVSMCLALRNIIDARGCCTAERALREAAVQAIAYREGACHEC